jgi:hypothetical protein
VRHTVPATSPDGARPTLAARAPDARRAPDTTAVAAAPDARSAIAKHPARRRRDAGAVSLLIRTTPDARAPRPDLRAAPAELLVAVGDCALSVGGRAIGRSPMKAALQLPPGRHEVVCRHASGKAEYRRTVQLRPGKRVELVGPGEMLQTEVRLRLTRGDAVRVRGQTHRQSFRAAVSVHDIVLLKDGAQIDKAWISVPPTGCTVLDTPRLICTP